jgi:hypothetical protein
MAVVTSNNGYNDSMGKNTSSNARWHGNLLLSLVQNLLYVTRNPWNGSAREYNHEKGSEWSPL